MPNTKIPNTKGAEGMNTLAEKAKSPTQERKHFTKRIGSTFYEVTVHFSKTSQENINDKVKRLIRNEVINSKAVNQ